MIATCTPSVFSLVNLDPNTSPDPDYDQSIYTGGGELHLSTRHGTFSSPRTFPNDDSDVPAQLFNRVLYLRCLDGTQFLPVEGAFSGTLSEYNSTIVESSRDM